MNSAVAEQAEKMQLALAAALHRLFEERDFIELLVGDQHVDLRDVHAHDAARTDIHVANFAVTHLPFGQANCWARGADQRVRELAEQFVVGWLAGERDGIALGFRTIAPAVEYGQYNGFRSLCHSQKEYTPAAGVVTQVLNSNLNRMHYLR